MELLALSAMIERGVPALPEPGGWYDQSEQLCQAVEYVLAERAALKHELESIEIEQWRRASD